MADPIHSLLAEMADELDTNRRCLMGDSSLVHPLAERARAALAAEPAGEVSQMVDLRHLLAIYVHAHQTGNSVPPHIDAEARAALAAAPPAPAPTINDLLELCEDHEFHLGIDGANEEESAEGLLQIILVALARWGNQPTAPDPHEALAARPLLEAVARMGDRIGQHTVREITVISDRAAHWLAQNPPGQPVAIEPRGCPTPGACSCVEAPAPAPVVEEDDGDDVISRWIDSRPGWPNDWPAVTQCQLTALIGEALEHWGRPATPPAPAVNHIPDATEMVPAADGEREELAQWLERFHEYANELGRPDWGLMTTRAAALLREPAPAPVPVALPIDDWYYDLCDALWWKFPVDEPPYFGSPLDSDWPGYHTHFTPVAIPQPPQGGEVAE